MPTTPLLAVQAIRARVAAISPDAKRRAIYLVGALPAVWYVGAFVSDQLGYSDLLPGDTTRVMERALGLWALRFLVIGLAITPLQKLAGLRLVRYRRAIGLLAFFYASLHLFAYLLLDKGFDMSAIWADVWKRYFITIGFAAFLILIPLAITSNSQMIKRLGGAAWQKLHKLVYVACGLGALHFLLLVKRITAEPAIYAGLVAVLLLYRVYAAWRKPAPRRNRVAAAE